MQNKYFIYYKNSKGLRSYWTGAGWSFEQVKAFAYDFYEAAKKVKDTLSQDNEDLDIEVT